MDEGTRRPAGHVYVDGEFWPLSVKAIHRRRLLVTDEQISWHDDSMEYRRVTAMAYYTDKVTTSVGPSTGYVYNIFLHSDKERFTISLFGPMKNYSETESAFRVAIGALHRHVEPRLINEIIIRIDQGGQLKVSNLTFSRDGLHRKGLLRQRFASWSETFEIRPSFEDPHVWSIKFIELNVYAKDSRNHRRKIGRITPGNPNSILAPSLINIFSARYGHGISKVIRGPVS